MRMEATYDGRAHGANSRRQPITVWATFLEKRVQSLVVSHMIVMAGEATRDWADTVPRGDS